MQRSDFRHFVELPVLWGHMEALGHVNNTEYFGYLEAGRIGYCSEVLPAQYRADANLVLADIQCRFLRQLRYPATIEVGTRIGRLGNSSMHAGCAIFIKHEDPPVAVSKAVMVWFDFASEKAVALPAGVRAAIMAYEPVAPEA
jgi:acyl-CoA thioester hydrolase